MPVSDRARAILATSHDVWTSAAVVAAGRVVGGTDVRPTLHLVSGAVDVDRSASHTRSFRATVVDESGAWLPGALGEQGKMLDPLYRPEFRLTRGIAHDGYREGWQLGRFVIEGSKISETTEGVVTAELSGRAQSALLDDPLDAPYTVNRATSDEAIKALLAYACRGRFPIEFAFVTTTYEVPDMMLDVGASPWETARKWASDAGLELYQSAGGPFVLRKVPDPLNDPVVWSYDEQRGSMQLAAGASRDVSSDKGYNGVVLTASGPWLIVPLRAEAWDTDPNSPTYYLGPFGKKAFSYDDATVTSQSQCDEAAAAKLRNVLGVLEEVHVDALVNPAHEEGDVIEVVNTKVGVADRAVLESFTISLSATDSMPISVRRQRRR